MIPAKRFQSQYKLFRKNIEPGWCFAQKDLVDLKDCLAIWFLALDR